MHNNDSITIARAQRALHERIRPAVHAERIALQVEVSVLPGEPIAPRDAIAGIYEPYRVGTPWGPAWGTIWFHVRATVPASWAGRRVEAILDLGFDHPRPGFQCEGLVYRPDGTEVKSVNPQNHWVLIEDDTVDLYVEAASNPVILVGRQFHATRQGDLGTASDRPLYTTRALDLAVFEPEVHALALDIDVLLGLQGELPDGPRRARVLQALDDALDLLDPRDIAGSASAVRARLLPVLESPAEASAHRIAAVGHAHIDSAWLWPVRETERKVARTVSSMLALIEETDTFVFGMSSAQQYDWIRRTRPELWQRVVDAVRAGRFLPLGGMWVESDTVMPSGESLVRQFLHGQRFFEREFGIRCRGVWLPDSFGYSPALPQLLRRAGFDWFFTQKISWNQTNDFPHHAFVWEGIDGTGVLTHFPPMDTYEAELSGAELARAARKFRENRIAPASIAPTGYGDGGGGTTREMVGRQQRTADLEGSARVDWQHPDVFFDELAGLEDKLPRWSGELYLELHRGTLTSQHAMKQGNRRLEHLLAEAEWWAATAVVRLGADYPYDELDAIWEAVLLNQFHDILPGTSIAWVHREAREQYQALAVRAEALIAQSLGELAGAGDLELTAQATGSIHLSRPSAEAEAARLHEDEDGWLLENNLVRVRVDRAGLITSAVDLSTGRDAILPGHAANLLQLHDDRPNQWDAWDVDRFYRNSRTDVVAVSSISAVAATITVERPLSAVSRVTQRISLAGRVLRLEQETHWHEDERFLKLSFPLDVRADHSIAETQFGVVARPTHTNTSWEDAQFETSMHRFVLVQEPGFGVAVVNESTHGYDITRVKSDNGWGVDLRLSLLRAPIYPDPETDRGFHRHEFGLVIGADHTAALRAAAALGSPDRQLRGAHEVEPLVRIEGAGLAISTVKAAADRSGDLIVRLHEHTGARARGRLRLAFTPAAARIVTLLEEPLDTAHTAHSAEGSDFAVELGPFEVQTWRLTR